MILRSSRDDLTPVKIWEIIQLYSKAEELTDSKKGRTDSGVAAYRSKAAKKGAKKTSGY